MTSNHTYCLPDTNIFLHYRFFTDIPWRKEIGASAVTVVVSDTVMSELAKHKRDSSKQRRSQRARTAESRLVKMLKNESRSATIRQGEELAYKWLDPTLRTIEENHLRWEEGDDCILALALQIKASEPSARVVVYSGDGPMQLKAHAIGVEVVSPTQDQELSEDPDPRDFELEKLRRELARRQSRMPDLKLRLNGSTADSPLTFALPAVPDVDEGQLAVAVDREMSAVRESARPSAPPTDWVAATFDQFAPRELERYQADLKDYESQYREFLMNMQLHSVMKEACFQIQPNIVNDGSDVAEDIDLFISVPRGVNIITGLENLPEPEAPERPKPPRKLSDFSAGFTGYDFGLSRNDQYDLLPPVVKTRWDEDYSVTVEETDSGHKARYHVLRLKHGMAVDLDHFYLLFPSELKGTTVNLEATIVCASQIDQPSFEFVVRIEGVQ